MCCRFVLGRAKRLGAARTARHGYALRVSRPNNCHETDFNFFLITKKWAQSDGYAEVRIPVAVQTRVFHFQTVQRQEFATPASMTITCFKPTHLESLRPMRILVWMVSSERARHPGLARTNVLDSPGLAMECLSAWLTRDDLAVPWLLLTLVGQRLLPSSCPPMVVSLSGLFCLSRQLSCWSCCCWACQSVWCALLPSKFCF